MSEGISELCVAMVIIRSDLVNETISVLIRVVVFD